MKVVVTGGAGYIGSHTCMELLAAGHEVFAIDNLCNGSFESIERVRTLSNRSLGFAGVDIRDGEDLEPVFDEFKPDAVIHFAGLKAVGESVAAPLRYYDVNVHGSVSLLNAMDRASCANIVFSSSATVYGDPEYLPYDEAHPTRPVNPYGRTKLMVEDILCDWAAVDPARRATALRYFNPVGAHVSGHIGEDPLGAPNNLMPFIAQVAVGRREHLNVLGNDYDTRDGTGLRDYIHVVDLAKAHVAAVERQSGLSPFEALNIGSGNGATVLELVGAFERASGVKIARKFAPRRDGDLPAFWADPTLAAERLGWQTSLTLDEMCHDTWRWQSNNPNGFNTDPDEFNMGDVPTAKDTV